jgi:RNA polymerase sigma-70 factor, ECF subfamily
VSELLANEFGLVDAIRAGDEVAFSTLVNRYGSAMLRLAQLYVRSRAVAEEVVQEAWIAVLNSSARFEGHSSLKTATPSLVFRPRSRRL